MEKNPKNIIAFIVTAILLTAMMPMGSVFKQNLKIGDKWSEATLSAAFDFPINKTKSEIEEDIKNSDDRFIPIYRIDSLAEELAINNVMFDYDLTKKMLSDSLTEKRKIGLALVDKLKSIYNKGLLNPKDEIYSKNDRISSLSLIRLIDGGELITMSTTNFYNPQEAKRLMEDAAIQAQRHTIINNNFLQLDKYLIGNIIYDKELSIKIKDQQKENISSSKGFITKGAVLITEGQIIDDKTFAVLSSYKEEFKKQGGRESDLLLLLGNLIFVSIILILTHTFLFQFRKEFASKSSNVIFLLFIYVFMMAMTKVISNIEFLNVYMIPFAIVPFFIITFYDIRMSVFEYISVLLICSTLAPIPFEFFVVNVTAGLAGVFVLQKSYRRTRLFVATGIILITYVLSYVALAFMQFANIGDINWSVLLWFILNVLLLLTLYQAVYLLEKIFGFVTNITLLELCDTNHPLLRELAEKAPGTFQHSLQVASLAETAADKIGANPLLARTGALYHDIGKSDNPLFFIENVTDDVNPHESHSPLDSANIIKRHVTDGVVLAKKYNIPQVIIDFIVSHHGTSVIYFFYHAHYLINKDDSEQCKELFSYDGQLPILKEASICMMADAVEAAARSQKDKSYESISAVIDKIIDHQIAENQFTMSNLSLAEISTIKETFKFKIAGIYHTRIVYPER